MTKIHTHKFSRFLGCEIVRGDEMMRVGCRDCDRVITVYVEARHAIKVNKVLDAILDDGEISTHEIMERCGINARGYLVRILRHLRDEGLVRMIRRGVYGPQPHGEVVR